MPDVGRRPASVARREHSSSWSAQQAYRRIRRIDESGVAAHQTYQSNQKPVTQRGSAAEAASPESAAVDQSFRFR